MPKTRTPVIAKSGTHECDNCGAKWPASQLREIQGLLERVEAGGVVPSGECPDCGALCYPEAERKEVTPLDRLRALASDLKEGSLDDVIHDVFDRKASVALADEDDGFISVRGDDVHDDFSERASVVNNQGKDAQLRFLLEELGEDEATEVVVDENWRDLLEREKRRGN